MVIFWNGRKDFFLSYLLQAGIYMSYMLLSAFLVQGPFSSAEDPVDFEAARSCSKYLPTTRLVIKLS